MTDSQPIPPRDDDRTRRFASLWVRSQATVSAYVFGLVRNPHDAEDVLSAIAEAAVADFDRYDPSRPFTAWVLGIARHRILHYFRTHRRDRHVFSTEAMAAIQDACESLESIQDERRAALNDCLRRLDADHRRLIEMRYLESMQPVTIAARTGASGSGAVRQKLHRVRQMLAECIRRRLGGEVSDG